MEGKSYQGTTQRDAVKGLLNKICVEKDLYPGTTQRDTQRVLVDKINISVGQQNYKTSQV